MSYKEGYLSDRLGRRALTLIRGAGIDVLSDELPWFPDGAVPPTTEALRGSSAWRVGLRVPPRFCLPSVLVPPMVYHCRSDARRRRTANRSYWTGPMVVTIEGDPLPDPRLWRSAAKAEIVAALPQAPWVGSLRCSDPIWRGEAWAGEDLFDDWRTVQAALKDN